MYLSNTFLTYATHIRLIDFVSLGPSVFDVMCFTCAVHRISICLASRYISSVFPSHRPASAWYPPSRPADVTVSSAGEAEEEEDIEESADKPRSLSRGERSHLIVWQVSVPD